MCHTGIPINDDDLLLRRLAPGHLHQDGTVNSNAYKRNGRPDPAISVDLACLTSVEDCLGRAPDNGFQVGALRVADVRALGLVVRHDPIDGNPAHAIIEGCSLKAHCRELARMTEVVVVGLDPRGGGQ